ncbi:ABC transporter ATP-binding protein [archaeon]|jgi:branched-chain amino acid transport system ATP-binding protein|nr:ABC transporter ATP-binding protein [archaeon]MBT6820012.1 ABC transporter ATP-binding protein [archaeon]MBT6955726.1 ABC transporter ATP-binding protein [archaeon]MBT7238668.1 ABC transporter ATP-binding protein [archaeon]MBT7567817.1 ABC transporter ATP-binding protein [archaeon]
MGMLQIQKLKSGYSDLEILHEVDFRAEPGEIIAIIGPNGAGKSTLLKSIFNLCEVNSGKITLGGKNITKLPTHDLIYEGVSYVPQGRQVFSDLTVKENLEMGAFIVKDKELIKRNLEMVFDKFPFLRTKKNDCAFTLSGGQQQMLAIGRALMQSPKILLLDEPSLGLSPKSMMEIFDKIKEINEAGVTVIIVEQNAKQAVKIANRTYILESGKVALHGGKEILKDKRVKDIYFG